MCGAEPPRCTFPVRSGQECKRMRGGPRGHTEGATQVKRKKERERGPTRSHQGGHSGHDSGMTRMTEPALVPRRYSPMRRDLSCLMLSFPVFIVVGHNLTPLSMCNRAPSFPDRIGRCHRSIEKKGTKGGIFQKGKKRQQSSIYRAFLKN